MKKSSLIITIIATALISSLLTTLGFHLTNNGVPDTPSNNNALLKRIDQLEKNALADQDAIYELQQLSSKKNKRRPKPEEDSLSLEIEIDDDQSNGTSEDSNNLEQLFRDRRAQRIARSQTEYKKQKLVSGGLTAQEADLILASETEITLQTLNNQYQSQREEYQNAIEDGTLQKNNREQLRESLGDDYFERYLEANNSSTSASINSVLENSPGFNAGLQSGDEITHYDGERVFNLRDVNQLTLQGSEGESVLIEVMRDGQPIQVTIPRGPIGVVSRRGRRR